jgi:hypothetical protein
MPVTKSFCTKDMGNNSLAITQKTTPGRRLLNKL